MITTDIWCHGNYNYCHLDFKNISECIPVSQSNIVVIKQYESNLIQLFYFLYLNFFFVFVCVSFF